jgi:hypothetical protein
MRLRTAILTLLLCAAPFVAEAQNSPFPLQQTATTLAAVTALGNGTVFATGQLAAVTIQLTGSMTSLTVSFEATNDGSNFRPLTCYTLDGNTAATSSTAVGIWRCNVNGLAAIRTRVSTYSSGTVTATVNGTSNAMQVRDVPTTQSGAIVGKLTGTQATAPTCAVTGSTCILTASTDSFMRGTLSGTSGISGTMTATFAVAYSVAPVCVASWNGTLAYGYYVQAVTPTTTTVAVKLGGNAAVTPTPSWTQGDQFSVLCAGIQ